MPIIRYGEKTKVLIAVGGHPFDRNAFAAIFEDLAGIAVSFADQPAAQRLMNPAGMAGFDALVLYDMPGIDFRSANPPAYVTPDPAFQAGFCALLESGLGVVAMHHAVAGWPAWPGYADFLGGAFLYRPGPLRGEPKTDGGYRHDVTYEACVSEPDHPVMDGIPSRFSLTDELYLYDTFDADILPLLRADFEFSDRNFYSAYAAVQGRMFDNENWQRQAGSPVIAWAKRALKSPLVYLQPGDGPSAYGNPVVRQLIINAITWVVSPEARLWAGSAS